MRKRKKMLSMVGQMLLLASGAGALLGCSTKSDDGDGAAAKGTLLFKNISCEGDGPTCETGLHYNKGLVDYIRETNKKNGFGGYQIQLETFDANYDHEKSQAKIDAWRAATDYPDVVGMFLWCTPEADYYQELATKDQKLSIPCSYAGHLATPNDVDYENSEGKGRSVGGPYTFFAGTDYSTTIRAAVKFMKDQGGKKGAFFYCSETDFCYSPIAAGRDYAAEIGLDLAPDYSATIVDYKVYNEQVKKYVTDNPDVDWVWCGNDTASCAQLRKALSASGSKAKMIFNNYALDERTAEMCGEDCTTEENTYGILAFTPFGDLTVDGMETVLEYHLAGRKADKEAEDLYANVRYVQGHVSGMMVKLAIDKLQEQGLEPTGKNVKEMLETFRNQSTAGLTEPLTFTSEDHRPNATARVYVVNSSGKLKFEKNIDIELKPEWLGW